MQSIPFCIHLGPNNISRNKRFVLKTKMYADVLLREEQKNVHMNDTLLCAVQKAQWCCSAGTDVLAGRIPFL
jgi:hypothetical protein